MVNLDDLFKMAAEKNPKLKEMVDEGEKFKQERISKEEKEKKDLEAWEQMQAEAMRFETANANKNKKIFYWKGSLEKYSLEGGIIFADSLEEAEDILFTSLNLTKIKENKSRFTIMELDVSNIFHHTFSYWE